MQWCNPFLHLRKLENQPSWFWEPARPVFVGPAPEKLFSSSRSKLMRWYKYVFWSSWR
jgi:hypothetical protein